MTIVNAVIRTRSKRPGGHYRGGRQHAEEVTEWVPGTLTLEQLEAMEADPWLEVEVLDAPAPEADQTGEAPAETVTVTGETVTTPEEAPAPEAAEPAPAPGKGKARD